MTESDMKKRLAGTLALATILTALPVTAVQASGNQYWTESAERVGYIEHVMNDGSIKSTFNTVHEKEIIQLRLNDTNKEAIEARTTEISKYFTKELQDMNADTIRTDIPTCATVTNVLVWNVEQSGTDDFTVAYEVDQQVKEGEQTQAVTENYTVTVHVDKDGAMVITQNPTLAPVIMYFRNW